VKIEADLTPELLETVNRLTVNNAASTYIENLDGIKNFFILNRDDCYQDADKEIKGFLIDTCYMQNLFRNFIQKKEGDGL